MDEQRKVGCRVLEGRDFSTTRKVVSWQSKSKPKGWGGGNYAIIHMIRRRSPLG